MTGNPSPRLFRFGLFEADLENACLTRKGVRIRVQDQPFRILAMLLEHPGQIVTREDLRRELWPAGTYVSFDPSLNMALNRLRAALDDDADNPRFIETIPKRGYRFIAPVTVESTPVPPADSEHPAEISDSAIPPGTTAANIPKPRFAFLNLGFILTVGLFCASVALAVVVALHRKPVPIAASTDGKPADPGASRRSVAVLGFQNVSGRSSDDWLSTALPEMLRTELGAGARLRVVPGENVAQFRAGAPWSQTDSLSQQTASRIGKALDSDLLVLGSFATVGGQESGNLRVDYRLQDAQTGEILYESAESGSEKQFFGLVAAIGSELRGRLGLPMISESEEAGVVSSLPSDPAANRFYSLGLEKLRDEDVAAGKDLLLQAEQIAPNFPLVHLALSHAWGNLGYDEKSRAEVKKAFELSGSLPATDRLRIQGAYYGNLHEHDKAIAAYRSLFSIYPDSVDDGLNLFDALNAAGRVEEALSVIRQLRKLPAPGSDNPRIDLAQAMVVGRTNPEDAQPLYETAVAKASAQGQKLLYARLRLAQCINRVYGPHPQGGEKYCQEAYDTFMAAGNRLLAADALRTMGDQQGGTGDRVGARQFYNRALALLVPLGEHEKTGIVLNNLAITYENQGDIAQAEKLFRRAAETWTQCGDSLNAGVALGNIGDILIMRGKLQQAEKQFALAKTQIEATDPNGALYDLYSIAEIRLYEGDMDGARLFIEQALNIARGGKSKIDIASVDQVLGSIQIAADQLTGARKSLQEALEVQQDRGDRTGASESEAALAEISLETGKPGEAEPPLRKALAEFHAESAAIDETLAATDLTRALLEQGKLSDAREALSDALRVSADSHDPQARLPLAILDARIQAAELSTHAAGKPLPGFSAPQHKLMKVIASAHQLGYYEIECEARLALAELELRTNPSFAHARLADLSRETRAHGLNLLSRKAASLAQSPVPPSGNMVSELR